MSIQPYRPKPVKEGDVLDVTIDDISKHGDGVAHVEKFVIFVRDAHQNCLQARVSTKVRIVEVRARFAVAVVIQ